MKKLINKAKSSFQDKDKPSPPPKPAALSSQPQKLLTSQPTQPSTITPPTPTDLLRYRYHHGTNLGSIFVLEKWLHGSMFPGGSPGGSELSAVSTSLKQTGLEATRTKWETHWRNACTDNDFAWLVNEAKCTSIRLPIGYFTLGSQFCTGTPFEPVKDVYVNAWPVVKEFITRARNWGIGVLLDLHAVPGGANGDAHSGSGSGKAELWGSKKNMVRAKEALVFIARETKGMGAVGIQVCNEAGWGAKGMYEWYEDVIAAIGDVDTTVPVYVSDAWEVGKCVDWVKKRRGGNGRNPVVVDTHKYYTFSEKDRSQSPQQIIGRVGSALGEVGGKADVVVGEWSCVLDGKTWGKVRPEEKDGLVRQFGQTQSKRWQEKSSGSYFWTYKMDWMDGGEWGFAEQTKKGNIPPPSFLTLPAQEVKNRTQNAQGQREDLAKAAREQHEGYWNRTSPGKQFQHQLYSDGYDVGYSDAQKFFSMRANGALGEKVAGVGGDKIGCLEIWVQKRLLESGQRGEFVWEWDQGFRKGVGDFNGVVGI